MTESKPTGTPPRRRRRLGKRRSQAELWGLISDVVLVVVLVGSALAIGTVHVPSLLAIAALALVGAGLEATGLRRVPWPAAVLAAFGLFSVLQAIKLPAEWVKRLSPVTAEVWLRCLVPFGEPALRSFPLSLDPTASIAEGLKWLTYACVYIMAMRTRVRRGSVWLAVALFGSVTLVSLITLVHGVADLSELYGLYHPDFTPGRWSVGPLLNSNNLAGYAILGLFAGGGLLLSERSPLPRLALMLGVGIIAAALCLSGSRAGIATVLVAGLVALVFRVAAQKARISVRALGLNLAPLLIGVVIAYALGSEHEAGQLTTLDVERKVSVWRWCLPMIREHALTGVGRGAFETAFPPYRGALDYDWAIVVSHAENFVIQWIAEWGVLIGGAAVLVVVGYVAREWYRSRGDRLRFMLMTGVLGLLVQNLADLGLEVPALAIAAVLALAAGERSAPVPATTSAEPSKRFGARALIVFAPAAALWVVSYLWSQSPVELERRELAQEYGKLPVTGGADELPISSMDELALPGEKKPAPPEQADQLAPFRSRLHDAVLRHPGEAFFPLLGALLAKRTHVGNPLTWIARALDLAPTNGSVHLVLAELMHMHGATSQAMLHLRLAAQYDRTLAGAVTVRAAAWAPSVEFLVQAIPDRKYGQDLLLDVCGKTQRTAELRLDCFRRAAQRDSASARTQMALAEALLAAIQAGQSPCKDKLVERCEAEAEAAARAAEKLDSKLWRPAYLRSKVLLARGDAGGAAELLTRTCPMNFEGDDCWHEALMIAIKAGANDAILKAANALGARPCDGMESCTEMLSSLASDLESAGQFALASKFLSKAAEAEPSAARWLKVAEVATRANLNGVARAALDRANRSFDATPTTRARVELLRERVAPATGTNL